MPENSSRVVVPAGIWKTDLLAALEPWYYRLAPFLMTNLLDDPAMLALAFC